MMLQKIKSSIDLILKRVLVLLMAVMSVNVIWQVISRLVLQSPSSFTEELARYMLVWVGILGASYVSGQKMHLAIDILPTRLTGRPKAYLEIFIELCVFIFALVVLVIGGVRLVSITLMLNQISAALQIKLGYVYSVLPLSGMLMMFYSFYFIKQQIKKLKS